MKITAAKARPYNNQYINNKTKQNSNIYIYISPLTQKFDFETSQALKNQILFKGNLGVSKKEELIQGAIEKSSLPIKPQTLDFVLSAPVDKANLYLKYSKTGSKFFELYSRYLLHKNYPIKDEGELTEFIAYFIKHDNKARIINDFIPKELLPDFQNKNATQIIQANCLNALLGAIIYENEDGFKTAFNFLNNQIGNNIFPKDLKVEESAIEKLERYIEKEGKSWQDIYQETRYFNEQWHYRIHYKNIILAQAQGGKHDHGIREKCAQEALDKVMSGDISLDEASDDNLIYTNYKILTPQRIKELEEFSKKWGLKFNDINLLHKVFLYGEMKDCSALAHSDTYEILEFIGDAVLGFCTHEILQDNLPNAPRETICSKRHAFVKNKNLSKVADEMNLSSYTINRNHTRGGKRTADLFEALIGAIFLDGGEDGVDNVYKFLDSNFRDEILNIEIN